MVNTTGDEGPRLMIVVSPRLLGDTLARALRAEGVIVIVADRNVAVAVQRPIDVAIISEPSADVIDIPLVIRLPAPEDNGIGAVTRRGHPSEAVKLDDVQSVVATVKSDGQDR